MDRLSKSESSQASELWTPVTPLADRISPVGQTWLSLTPLGLCGWCERCWGPTVSLTPWPIYLWSVLTWFERMGGACRQIIKPYEAFNSSWCISRWEWIWSLAWIAFASWGSTRMEQCICCNSLFSSCLTSTQQPGVSSSSRESCLMSPPPPPVVELPVESSVVCRSVRVVPRADHVSPLVVLSYPNFQLFPSNQAGKISMGGCDLTRRGLTPPPPPDFVVWILVREDDQYIPIVVNSQGLFSLLTGWAPHFK